MSPRKCYGPDDSHGNVTMRCPTCGRFLGVDPDGYWDTEPGGLTGFDPVVAYCSPEHAAKKDPPSRDGESHP